VAGILIHKIATPLNGADQIAILWTRPTAVGDTTFQLRCGATGAQIKHTLTIITHCVGTKTILERGLVLQRGQFLQCRRCRDFLLENDRSLRDDGNDLARLPGLAECH
jgi:hypothetical protein